MDNRTSKPSATEQVYEALRGRISSGEWRPGERLPSESELAASFGVNRLTVRMALQKLAALGVTATRTGSGTYVLDFDLDGCLRAVSGFALRGLERKHLTEFRNHMEIECARLACERAAPEELDELARLAAEHRRAWLDDSAEHELWCRVVEAVDELPERCREICRMTLAGKKPSQIAEELGLSVETVKKQKKIAIQKLKDRFGIWVLLLFS